MSELANVCVCVCGNMLWTQRFERNVWLENNGWVVRFAWIGVGWWKWVVWGGGEGISTRQRQLTWTQRHLRRSFEVHVGTTTTLTTTTTTADRWRSTRPMSTMAAKVKYTRWPTPASDGDPMMLMLLGGWEVWGWYVWVMCVSYTGKFAMWVVWFKLEMDADLRGIKGGGGG